MSSVYRLVGWGYVGLCAAIVSAKLGDRSDHARRRSTVVATSRVRSRQTVPQPSRTVEPAPVPVPEPAPVSNDVAAAEWFRRAKPYCNSVEIGIVERNSPPPATTEGSGYHAACLGLAGRIDDARRTIDLLPQADQQTAANIVFGIGHPVADAGDDRAAGPMMELVVDYIPSHYMALYHAGMAEYMLGQGEQAKKNLTEFLRYYPPKDGWRNNAEAVLSRLAGPETIAADPRRPREP